MLVQNREQSVLRVCRTSAMQEPDHKTAGTGTNPGWPMRARPGPKLHVVAGPASHLQSRWHATWTEAHRHRGPIPFGRR
jgi:hypothetical protein